jgi:hypothetical protein
MPERSGTDTEATQLSRPSASVVEMLALPPRHVPLGVRLRVLFGGPMQQFGWLFFGFGLAFVWAFAFNSDVGALVRPFVPVASAVGSVIDVTETNASENDSMIYAVSYQFAAPDGKSYNGTSYTTGLMYAPGDRAPVEFAIRRPQDSHLKGARRAMFGPAALLSALFPAIGLVFVTIGMWDGVKANQLLRSGRLALARLRTAEGTNASVNNRQVVRLVFEFVAHDGTPHAVEVRTSLPDPLQDEAEEIVLFDPGDPDYAVMLDGLPGPPHLTSAGELEGAPFLRVALVCALPFLTLVGNGLYALVRFLL